MSTVVPTVKTFSYCRLMVLTLGPNASRLIPHGPHGFEHISRSSRVTLSPVEVIRIELTIFGVTQHCYIYAVIL